MPSKEKIKEGNSQNPVSNETKGKMRSDFNSSPAIKANRLSCCKHLQTGVEKCLHVTFSHSRNFLYQASRELGVTVVLKG